MIWRTPQIKKAKSAILRYGIGLASFAFTLVLALVFLRFSIKLDLSLLVVLALLGSAWYGGRGPGLMVAVLFELATVSLRNPIQAPWISLVFMEFNRTALMAILVLLVSSRKNALEQLAKLAAIVETSDDAIIGATLDGVITSWNAGAQNTYGYSAGEVLSHSASMLVPAGRQEEVPEILARLRTGEHIRHFETVRLRKDGTEFNASLTISPISDRSGNVLGISIIARDVTERRDLEEQLRQSQKMEAIGRLAGGVAHDFNNLLTAIIGYSQLALQGLHREDPLHGHIKEIENAGTRAAALTKQLLALSRRQVLQPAILELNLVVGGIEGMLRRLIGEDIHLTASLDPELGRVKADPGQIEQVIMNLAVNARDAMPNGGHLIIETAGVVLDEHYAAEHPEVRPGPYALLAVSDSGTGMDKETQARIFEPFFTTKELGKGTGLGLSTVFGIVKQSGGHVSVYSEPGHGTTLKVYLPVTDELSDAVEIPPCSVESLRGSETVLLVEDEDIVRRMASQVLKMNGYVVLEASNGGEALQHHARYGVSIHLMITDMVMPHISGRELAERLSPWHPTMRVLYMSGYTDTAIVHHGVLDPGTAFIQKPFTPDGLARKVRHVLDANEPIADWDALIQPGIPPA